MSEKLGWQIMKDAAEKTQDPVMKEQMLALAENARLSHQQRRNEMIAGFIFAKFCDLVVVFISLCSVGVVVYLFTQSIFEGFISFVAAVFLLRCLFKTRNDVLLSWFFQWF